VLLRDAIGQVRADSRGTYGYRRVRATLRIESGLIVNHKLVASILAEVDLHGLPQRRARRRNLIAARTTRDLVNRSFTANGPDQLWVTDVTQHPRREGRVSASIVEEEFPRRLPLEIGSDDLRLPDNHVLPPNRYWRRLREPQCCGRWLECHKNVLGSGRVGMRRDFPKFGEFV
jgi:transposase InsO family protein